jgi:putative membrane protein
MTALEMVDGIHLKQCVSLYLFSLPFTLVGDLGCVVEGVILKIGSLMLAIQVENGSYRNGGMSSKFIIYRSKLKTPPTVQVAFTLMGIEGIADEIEMPFGHDTSDLPLGILRTTSFQDAVLY